MGSSNMVLELTLAGAECTPQERQREPKGVDPFAVLQYGSQHWVAKLIKGLKFGYRLEDNVNDVVVKVFDAKQSEPRDVVATILLPAYKTILEGSDRVSSAIVKPSGEVLGHLKVDMKVFPESALPPGATLPHSHSLLDGSPTPGVYGPTPPSMAAMNPPAPGAPTPQAAAPSGHAPPPPLAPPSGSSPETITMGTAAGAAAGAAARANSTEEERDNEGGEVVAYPAQQQPGYPAPAAYPPLAYPPPAYPPLGYGGYPYPASSPTYYPPPAYGYYGSYYGGYPYYPQTTVVIDDYSGYGYGDSGGGGYGGGLGGGSGMGLLAGGVGGLILGSILF